MGSSVQSRRPGARVWRAPPPGGEQVEDGAEAQGEAGVDDPAGRAPAQPLAGLGRQRLRRLGDQGGHGHARRGGPGAKGGRTGDVAQARVDRGAASAGITPQAASARRARARPGTMAAISAASEKAAAASASPRSGPSSAGIEVGFSTRCYPQDEARLTRVRKKPRILFLTRLWTPEEPAARNTRTYRQSGGR